MTHDYGPSIVALAITGGILAIVAYIAHSTCTRLVGHELRESVQATYRMRLPKERVQAQEDARNTRLHQARSARRVFSWCALVCALLFAATADVLLMPVARGTVGYLVFGASLIICGVYAWWLFSRKVEFPPMPERDEDDILDASSDSLDDTQKGTVTTPSTDAIVKKANPQKRARRKSAAASRKKNRR